MAAEYDRSKKRGARRLKIDAEVAELGFCFAREKPRSGYIRIRDTELIVCRERFGGLLRFYTLAPEQAQSDRKGWKFT